MKKKTILITGSQGFLGRNLCKVLQSKYQLLTPDKSELDLQDINSIHSTLDKYQPDCIIHLGAISNPSAILNTYDLINININGTHALLDNCKPGCRFIFASSIVVCGTAANLKCEGNIQNPTSLYGGSKAAAENLVTAYTNLGKINGISLRFCAIVGNNNTHGMLKDFIKKAEDKDNPFRVLGKQPGSNKPYIYISDAIKAIELAIQNDNIQGPINITNQPILSVEEIANIILDYYNLNSKISWSGDTFAGDNLYLNYSNSLAKQLLDWSPNFDSREAIYQVLDDHKLQQNFKLV